MLEDKIPLTEKELIKLKKKARRGELFEMAIRFPGTAAETVSVIGVLGGALSCTIGTGICYLIKKPDLARYFLCGGLMGVLWGGLYLGLTEGLSGCYTQDPDIGQTGDHLATIKFAMAKDQFFKLRKMPLEEFYNEYHNSQLITAYVEKINKKRVSK